MDQERERIQQDLRGLLEGDVHCDDLFVQMYASDASIFEIRPLGVVRVRGLNDVVACLQYATEHKIPIHARGAGTGLAGESLGPGLIVDFSAYMRRVIEIGPDTARIQPGIVHAQLNRQLAPHGRLFGPDPATRSVTTMGSVLALDGGGSHWLKYGSARGRVVSLQVVLADGTVIDAEPVQVDSIQETMQPRRAELVQRLSKLFQREAATIELQRNQTKVDRAGYRVHDVLVDGVFNLPRLLVGSEGTLGLITEAVVRTDPLPKHRGVMLLFFERLESAAQGALMAAQLGVTAADLLDRRLLTISREVDDRFDHLLPRTAEAMVLVEVEGNDRQELHDRLQEVASQIQRQHQLAFGVRIAIDEEERNLFWNLVRRVVPRLHRLKGASRPVPFVEDIAIPPAELPEFLVRTQHILRENQFTATVFAHAGHGQLHIRPFLDLDNEDQVRRMEVLATSLYEEVLKVGGTISGEHGEGLSRTWFGRRQHGPLYDVFREIKRIFDPNNILNPGKVVADLPQPLTKNLRPPTPLLTRPASTDSAEPVPTARSTRTPFEWQQIWQENELVETVQACNGCGRCRTQSDTERMCPIFRFAPREESSPRAKANLLRAILNERLEPQVLSTEQLKSVADLCVNCHQCRLECPAEVDVPKLMIECKSQYVLNNGLRPTDLLVARPELFSLWASRFATVANWALANRSARWLLDKLVGLAPARKLPRVAPRSFLRLAQRQRLNRPSRGTGAKVLYFVDQYANWHDIQLAEAFVRVMRHNGVSVYVPPHQRPSGMPAIAFGALDIARRNAKHNVALLADAIRQGYQIVTTEPSAALCLTHEYLNLLEDEDVRLVARHTSEACGYLWRLHRAGKLELDLKPVNATLGYHQPCHLRALSTESAGVELLRLIPGLQIHQIVQGCSGMAGAFGLQHKNYRSSLRAGRGMLNALRDPALQCGTTECSACKLQMEQGTNKPTLHPLKILALSYGLMPEVAQLLSARSKELVIT
jgi:FAD/FMN-containing dehydrogenase/Fe-S oxidoreductase